MSEFGRSHEQSATDRRDAEKPSIRLIFRRHDQKTVESTSGPRPNDATVGLTPAGRAHAAAEGKNLGINPAMVVVGGSSRDRSTETVRLMAEAGEPDIDRIVAEPGAEAEREKAWVEGLRAGGVPGADRKSFQADALDFHFETPAVHAEYYKHYLKEQNPDTLRYMREESDALVERTGDRTSDSYSRNAGKVAELVKRYLNFAPRWERIYAEKPGEYSGREVQRLFGTHQTVTEPFLMKIADKLEGPGASEALFPVGGGPDGKLGNGFPFSEGFEASIEADQAAPGGVRLRISCRGRSWDVPAAVIDEIIRERDELNGRIGQAEGENHPETPPA